MTGSGHAGDQVKSNRFGPKLLASTLFNPSLLLPLATVCLVYSWNVDRIPFEGFVVAALILCGLNFAITLAMNFILRGSAVAGVLVNAGFTGMVVGTYFVSDYLAVWFTGWMLICLFVIVRPAHADVIKSLIFSIVFAVFCLSGYKVFSTSSLFDESGKAPNLEQAFAELPTSSKSLMENRDVYYIVMDRYARDDQLQSVYGFDNSGFLNALKERGFFVADAAYSNYQRTAHSLSSSLNMRYLDDVGADGDVPSRNWLPLYRSIENSVAARFFKRMGYDFHFLGSWWEPSRKNRLADSTFNYRAWPELVRVLFENSVFGVMAHRYEIASLNPRQLQCQRAKLKFDALNTLVKTSNSSKPKFVFAHFLVPHPPFVLDADGSCISAETAESRSREENYVNQIKYANSELLSFLDTVATVDDEKPVIVLQADEGPWPKKYVADEIHFLGRDVTAADWSKATSAELREKMGILNALYLPGLDDASVSPDFSPVNNLRLVLREYFKVDISELPNEAFIFRNSSDIYRFESVSDKLQQE